MNTSIKPPKRERLSLKDSIKARHIRHKARTNPERFGFTPEDVEVIEANKDSRKLMNTYIWLVTTSSGIKIDALRYNKLIGHEVVDTQ